MAGTFQCTICGHFRALNLKIFLSHCNIAHGNDISFQVACGIGGCLGKFSKFNSFYKYIRRHYKKEYDDTDQGNDSGRENREENLSDEDFIVDHDYEMPGEINEESCSSEIVSDSDTNLDNQEIQSCCAKQVENIYSLLEIFAGINFNISDAVRENKFTQNPSFNQRYYIGLSLF